MKDLTMYINEKINFHALKEKIMYSFLFIKSEKKGEAENRLAKLCKEKYPGYSIILKSVSEITSTKNDCVNYYITTFDEWKEATRQKYYCACIKKDGESEYALCNWSRKYETDTKYYLPKLSDTNIEHALNYGYDCLTGVLKQGDDAHLDPKYEYGS